jgi:hypothetical protein
LVFTLLTTDDAAVVSAFSNHPPHYRHCQTAASGTVATATASWGAGKIHSRAPFVGVSPSWKLAASNSESEDDMGTDMDMDIDLDSLEASDDYDTDDNQDDGNDDIEDNDNDKNDGDEWTAVLAAFKMYKAAYGDLKVPQRFIVPNMAPWPEISWGYKLGRTVAAIRQTGKLVNGTHQTVRREILEGMGFVWSVRMPRAAIDIVQPVTRATVQQAWLAVKAYKELVQPNTKPLAIPSNFVVPNVDPWPDVVRGLPLGPQLAAMQSVLEQDVALQERFAALGYYVVDPNAAAASAAALAKEKETNMWGTSSTGSEPPVMTAAGGGRTISASEARFQKVYSALVTYKKIYGDLLVPQPFVVPDQSADWPKESWSLRLGARVNAIRSQGTFVNNNPERRTMLDDIEFAWSPPKSDRGRPGRKPRNLEDDDDSFDDLPDFSAEIESSSSGGGGSSMDALKESGAGVIAGATSSDLDSLFGSSFDFGKDFLPSDGNEKAPQWGLEGGRDFSEAVTSQEPAPEVDEYQPKRTLADTMRDATVRALEVGVIESVNEKGRVVKGKRTKDIPWFNDDFGDDFVFEDVVEALTVYKNIYGDFSNLTESGGDFFIPGPDASLGYDDDDLFDGFDQVDASARAAAAISQFEERGNVDRSEDLIAAEIKRLQGEVSTSMDTDVAVVREITAAEWPEHLAGMALGSLVTRICDGSLEVKHIPERKAELDAIDFDWGDPMEFMDVPFEKAMCAMYAYYLVRGDMFVYADFVMPDEDPWPQALAGYELGKAVQRIRELQNFLEAYHSEKVSLLRMIDFIWFPTTALPLDPSEKEMTSETLLLSAMGHPDYAKMIDIPMGLPDKIIADGPFLDSDDPKKWWRKWHNWEYVKDYWYQQGRRDNAYVLRGMGYPQMAAEHEAKYGPGFFQQINATMQELEAGTEDTTQDEKRQILETLNFYRQEMLGCTDLHPQDRDQLLEDLDFKMLAIMKEGNLDLETEDELVSDDYESFDGDDDAGGDAEYEEEVVNEEGDNVVEEFEVEEFDVEDELGLDTQ